MKPLDPRLLRYSRSSRGFLISTVLIGLFNAFATISQAFLITQLIVSFFQSHESFISQKQKVLSLALVFIFRSFLSFLNERLAILASTKIKSELRMAVVKKTIENDGRDVQEFGTSGIALLVTKGIGNLDAYFAKFIPQLFIAVIVPLSVGITIAARDLRSGLIVLLTIPLVPLFGILIGKFTASATKKKWETLNLLSGYFLDLLSGLTTLRVYGRHRLQDQKLKVVGDQYRKETMKVLRISFLSSLALELVATLSVALLAVTIGLRLVSGSISLEIGLFILIIAPEVYWPIRQVSAYFHSVSDGLEAFNAIFKILDRPAEVGSSKFEKVLAITWSNLVVTYPNRSEIHIPSGQISIGDVHGLIGRSGSGKSTLVNIILGFVKPTSGEVQISTNQGTFPLNDIDLKYWRKQISWSPQEPRFPVSTIGQILKYAKPAASDIEIIETLKKVELDIADLVNGLRTELGNIKQPLSIGQLRKVALARAIIKEAPILILDEPTASIDDISELAINKVIKDESEKGRAVLLISHRESSLLSMNKVTDMARAI